MTTKKTSAPNKTTTKAAKLSSADPRPSRRLADCPFPEHLRVELDSAQTEVLKSLVAKDAPLPVFSTRALDHGLKASGAAGLREGFAWNPQMDLAWALGYPKMTFIIDGALAAESKDAILAFYGRTASDLESDSWFDLSATVYPGLVPRRAAFALLYELEHGEHPFDLSEEEFLEATEPRDLSPEDVRTILEQVDEPSSLERIALLVEALAGSSLVGEVLGELYQAHPPADDEECSDFQIEITGVLYAMLRRVPSAEANALRERCASDPRAEGMQAFAAGSLELAIEYLQWVDAVEDQVLHAFLENSKRRVGDVPFPRYLFAGGDKLIETQVALFEQYMDGPKLFFSQYSTIRHPLLAGPALLTRAERKYREGMTLWLESHADFLRPLFEGLREDPKLGRHASDALKELV